MSKLYLQKQCNICKKVPNIIIDAPWKGQRWAWMCPECRAKTKLAGRFGIGVGQAFRNIDGGTRINKECRIKEGLENVEVRA